MPYFTRIIFLSADIGAGIQGAEWLGGAAATIPSRVVVFDRAIGEYKNIMLLQGDNLLIRGTRPSFDNFLHRAYTTIVKRVTVKEHDVRNMKYIEKLDIDINIILTGNIHYFHVILSAIEFINQIAHEDPIGNTLDEQHLVGKEHFRVVRIKFLNETLPIKFFITRQRIHHRTFLILVTTR